MRLICGAPGSGKTTYVAQHAQRGDLIIDVDALYHAMSGLPWYDKPKSLLGHILAARDGALDELSRTPDVNAWIIADVPTRTERDAFRARLNAEVAVMETPVIDCLERISQDGRRAGQLQEWMPRVLDWWRRYERDERDGVIV